MLEYRYLAHVPLTDTQTLNPQAGPISNPDSNPNTDANPNSDTSHDSDTSSNPDTNPNRNTIVSES